MSFVEGEAQVTKRIDMKKLGAKDDSAKLRWDLLDDSADEALAAVLTLGASKYSEGGWRHVDNSDARYYAALRRHLRGHRKFLVTGNIADALDAETGLPHVAQALCNLHFLTALFLRDHMPSFDGQTAAQEAIGRWRSKDSDEYPMNKEMLQIMHALTKPSEPRRKKARKKVLR